MKPTKLVIEDSENIKNVFVQLDLKKNTTMVMSNFSAWDNLFYLMEAILVTAEKCIADGMSKHEVYETIKKHFVSVLGEYQIRKDV
jgi:hypothetical protein